MADLEKTVKIIFAGDDRVSPTITGVSGSMDKLSAMANTVADPFARAGEAILKIDAALAALAVGGMAYALKKSVEFETAVVDLTKVVGKEFPDQIKAASLAAIGLSNTYGESSAKILQSTADFAQAGFTTKEAMDLTKVSMDLVIAGGVTAAESSAYLVSILKGFKAPAEDAARVVDILNEVSNKYATDVRQLAIGMADLSPIAKTMGFSMEETAGILTPVIEVFRSGSESAMALKTGLLKLVDDAKPVQEALKSLGISQKDANGQLRSGKDILLDVQKAFQGLADPQKLFVTQQLVGIEQSARMMEVFNALAKTTEVTGVAMKSAGSAAEEVAARLASAQVQINILKVGFENLGIAVGDKFRASAVDIVKGANDISSALSGAVNAGAFDPVFQHIASMNARIGEMLKVIAQNLPAAINQINFGGLLNSLGELGRAFGSWFGEIDLTTVDGLAKALQTVIDIITGVVDVTTGMTEAFGPFVQKIAEFFIALARGDEESKNTLGHILALAMAVESLGLGMVAAVAIMKEYEISMTALFNIVAGGVQLVWNVFQLLGDSVGGVFIVIEGAFLEMIRVLSFGLASLFPAFQDLEAVVTESGKRISGNIDQNGIDAARGLDRMIKGFNELATGAAGTEKPVKAMTETLGQIPIIDVGINTEDAIRNIGKAVTAVKEIPEEKKVAVVPQVNEPAVRQALKVVNETLDDGTVVIRQVGVNASSLDSAKKKIDQAVPKKKTVEVDLETKKLKEQSDIIQKSLEWKAKLDMAEIEAGTKRFQAMFQSIDEGMKGTGDLIGTLFGKLDTATGSKRSDIMDQIDRENKRREQEFDLQQKLVNQQVAMNELKMSKMRGNEDVGIKIEAAGLQPHLEMILWQILEAIQIRANAEQAEFLLGV